MSKYHTPALLHECIEGLAISDNGTYVDATFGGGGHSKEILKNIPEGRLIAFDQDPEAQENEIEDDRFTLVRQNFKYLKNFLKLHRAIPVDGILADLGISSHQINTAERGFSTRFDGPLDMRMDKSGKLNAATVVNEYSKEDLTKIFKQYGEIKNASNLAFQITEHRKLEPIKTTQDLNSICEKLVQDRKRAKYLAQVYQAIRIEVNQELEVLKDFLKQCVEVLSKNGRIAIISYHSLEDRIVKTFFKTGNFDGELNKDFYGNLIRPLNPINNKIIIPTDEEIERNPRARSARLRIASLN
ncbi:MAG: 16S rRNA (cytosine(1402)-N(4))-methyltransferase [Crocinitomicaceae bacterium]|nr:16S rRNA (cytosine(1402)-N(4))-methyltransferase [Crocinitomicaceae bacterium]|tara:strand:+ start:5223 stop:6122 length:900 start_codon:yes stop_codon:yes gene_type:complete